MPTEFGDSWLPQIESKFYFRIAFNQLTSKDNQQRYSFIDPGYNLNLKETITPKPVGPKAATLKNIVKELT